MLIKWFPENYLVTNADKSQFLIAKYHENVSVVVDNEIIEASDTVKLLGIIIDNKLDFTAHISKICKKFSTKLS